MQIFSEREPSMAESSFAKKVSLLVLRWSVDWLGQANRRHCCRFQSISSSVSQWQGCGEAFSLESDTGAAMVKDF